MAQRRYSREYFATCPIRNIVSRFGDKWSLLVLLTISGAGVMRYNEIEKAIPDVSSRVLSSTLKTLEQDNLIHRKVYPVVPPKVEYSLTETGESLMPIVHSLTAWAKDHFDTIMSHRKKARK
ncbi:MAG: helix-turn-helix transcriptional regulator [Bacteroidales bacterium]|nr:helix-turn-helix transcriptional regulator [Bacteroidales bacterium]